MQSNLNGFINAESPLYTKLSNPIGNNYPFSFIILLKTSLQFDQPLEDKILHQTPKPGKTAEASGNIRLHSVQAHTPMQAFICSASDPHANLVLIIPKTISQKARDIGVTC